MIHTLELPLPELLQRVRRGEIPLNSQATITFDDSLLLVAVAGIGVPPLEATPTSTPVGLERDEEEVPLSAEELEAERRLFEQFEHNVNQTRAQAAMRLL